MPDNKREKQSNRSSPLQNSRVIAPIVAVCCLAAIGVAVAISEIEPQLATQNPFDGEQEARPPGAGTMPDGVADTLGGGLGEGTSPEEVVDGSQSSDLVSPLVEGVNDTPPQSETAEGLEPIDGEEGPILDQIEEAQDVDIETQGSDDS